MPKKIGISLQFRLISPPLWQYLRKDKLDTEEIYVVTQAPIAFLQLTQWNAQIVVQLP